MKENSAQQHSSTTQTHRQADRQTERDRHGGWYTGGRWRPTHTRTCRPLHYHWGICGSIGVLVVAFSQWSLGNICALLLPEWRVSVCSERQGTLLVTSAIVCLLKKSISIFMWRNFGVARVWLPVFDLWKMKLMNHSLAFISSNPNQERTFIEREMTVS